MAVIEMSNMKPSALLAGQLPQQEIVPLVILESGVANIFCSRTNLGRW